MAPQVLKHPILQGRIRRPRWSAHLVGSKPRALLVKEVVFLEDYLECESSWTSMLPAPSCLPCTAVLAWVILKRFARLFFDFMPSGEGFIQLVSLSHKSRRFTLSTGLKMFLVAPTKGLSRSLWGVTWCKVAEQLGMPLTSIPHGGPVLQAPLENGSMSGFPIKGCAFAMWIREILATSPDKLGHGLTGHSAKCTALSWMSKLNCSELSRCILGHHVPKCSTAVLTYSRDEQSGPLRELVSAYADIRSAVRAGRNALRHVVQP